MIQERILELTEYGLVTGLTAPEDKRYTINRLLELFGLEELEDEVVSAYEKRTPMTQESAEEALEGILAEMLDYAAEQMLIPENTITYRDLFDTKIMSMLVPHPSEVIRTFRGLYERSPQEATDYFYKLSRDTDYIRRYRIKKDLKWTADTEFVQGERRLCGAHQSPGETESPYYSGDDQQQRLVLPVFSVRVLQ